MPIRSRIVLMERVTNTDRRFGSSQQQYFPARIIDENEQAVPALFTQHDIDVAVHRAHQNPEDTDGMSSTTLFERLFIAGL